MAEKAVRLGPDIMRMAEKSLLLQVLDQQWKEHLLGLDQLRQGISLRAYAQKDPLNEYKREAFLMFESMLASLRETTSFQEALKTGSRNETASWSLHARSRHWLDPL